MSERKKKKTYTDLSALTSSAAAEPFHTNPKAIKGSRLSRAGLPAVDASNTTPEELWSMASGPHPTGPNSSKRVSMVLPSAPTPSRSSVSGQHSVPAPATPSKSGPKLNVKEGSPFSDDDKEVLSKSFHAWLSFHNEKSQLKRKAGERKGNIRDVSLTGLSAAMIASFYTLIFYQTYLMMAPYLTPTFLAFLAAVPLGVVKQRISDQMSTMDQLPSPVAALFQPVCVLFGLSVAIYLLPTLNWILIPILVFQLVFIFAFMMKSSRESVLSLMMIILVIVTVAVPFSYWVQSCVTESQLAGDTIVEYVNTNEQFQELIKDTENSTIYKMALEYADEYGVDRQYLDIAYIKEQVTGFVTEASSYLNILFDHASTLIANIGNFVSGLVAFLSMLFFFVSNWGGISHYINELSPFEGQDHKRLMKSLQQSASSIFVVSFLVASLQFTTTFFTFWATGLGMKNIFAALSAFLSTVPLLGNWLIWIPAAGVMALNENYYGAGIIAVAHIISTYVIQPAIYERIPGNPLLVSLSLVFGIAQFGVLGALYGPLLAGLTVTLTDILRSYYSTELDDEEETADKK